MFGTPFATVADVYGTGTGLSTQQSALVGPDNASTTSQGLSGASSGSTLQTKNLLPGLSGINPLVGIVVVLLVLVGVKHLREWKSAEGDVKDVKVGLYFVIVTTLAAAAGLPILKAILAKYQIPGVSAYVLNA